jgi:hypothetical protein
MNQSSCFTIKTGMLKEVIRSFFFLILVIAFSCEEQGLFLDCQDCTAEIPTEALLEAKLDDNINGTTRIDIYEGNIEDNILYGTFDASNYSVFNRHVPINKKYTVSATYYVSLSDKRFVAIDSATPRVKYEKAKCSDPCYFVYDRIVNLKIKYTK